MVENYAAQSVNSDGEIRIKYSAKNTSVLDHSWDFLLIIQITIQLACTCVWCVCVCDV